MIYVACGLKQYGDIDIKTHIVYNDTGIKFIDAWRLA